MSIQAVCECRPRHGAKPSVAHRIGTRERRKNRKILGGEAVHHRRSARRTASVAFIVPDKPGHIGLLPRCRWILPKHLLHHICEIMTTINPELSLLPRLVIYSHRLTRGAWLRLLPAQAS